MGKDAPTGKGGWEMNVVVKNEICKENKKEKVIKNKIKKEKEKKKELKLAWVQLPFICLFISK